MSLDSVVAVVGALVPLVGAITALVIALVRLHGKVTATHNLVNSRMDELLRLTRASSHAEGELAGRDDAAHT